MIRKTIAAIAALALLAGCATATTVQSPKATAAQIVFAMKADYLVPQRLAAKYSERPPCPAARALVCKDAAAMEQIKKGNTTAVSALDTAEEIARDPAATENRKSLAIASAKSAIKVVSDALDAYGVK